MPPYSFNFNFNVQSRREGKGIDSPVDAEGRTELHVSVERGDIPSVTKLLQRNANPNQQDKHGQTPLYSAIAASNKDMAGLLADHAADINISDDKHRTPMMWAVEKKCSIEFLEHLRHLGGNLDKHNKHERSLLHVAAAGNRPDIIDYLLLNGAEISHADDDGKTAVHLAVEMKAYDALRHLLEKGANPLARTGKIETPLHIAAAAGDMEAVGVLLAAPSVRQTVNDFKIYASGFTPLMAAVANNHLDVAKTLIGIGADTNQRDISNRHSLFIAAEAGHYEMAKMLIENGADVANSPRSSRNKSSIIHDINPAGYDDMLLLLYSAGADINAVDAKGRTPLRAAADMEDIEGIGDKTYVRKIKSLLKLGADPDIADKFGNRPIDAVLNYIYNSDSAETVGALLKHGANPDMSPSAFINESPLHNAARYGNIKVVRLLLAHNAMVDEPERGQQGMTPFLITAAQGWQEVGKLLMENGADPLKKNLYKRGALHLAGQQGSDEFIENFLKIPGLKQQIDAPDIFGLTPLHIACRIGRWGSAAALIKNGANPCIYDDSGMMPIHYAASCSNDLLLPVFTEIAKSHEIWNAKSLKEGDTPLHVAVRTFVQSRAEQLIGIGCDVAAKNNNGETPLHMAASTNQVLLCGSLVEHMKRKKIPIDQNRDNSGRTALHCAADKSLATINILLAGGADINATTSGKDTPLHIAVRGNNRDAVEAFLLKGADMRLVNAAGASPLDIAKELKHEHLVIMLTDAAIKQKIKPSFQPPKP